MFLELRDRFRVLLCMVDGNTKREMRTVTRTASNFLFDVFFFFSFYLSRDVKCCMIRNDKYRWKVFRRINGILDRQDDRIERFN